VYIGKTPSGQAQMEVTNTTHTEIGESDLRHMFEPLWQKDASRTSEDNFGLGLSIVSALCGAIGAAVTVDKLDHNHISFSVTFKKAS
jgi:signal transduction histidine kinase